VACIDLGDTSYVAYHPLDLAAVEIAVDMPVERHPAVPIASGMDICGSQRSSLMTSSLISSSVFIACPGHGAR
jgi:hypothetical protein